jgi:hypothetical protein
MIIGFEFNNVVMMHAVKSLKDAGNSMELVDSETLLIFGLMMEKLYRNSVADI